MAEFSRPGLHPPGPSPGYPGTESPDGAYPCPDRVQAVRGGPAAGMAVPAPREDCPRRPTDLHIGVHDPGHLSLHMSALAGGNIVKERVTMKKLMFALFDRVLGFGRLLEAGREELILDD